MGAGNEGVLMARYNTFVVVDCARRKVLMVTSSARKANSYLAKGVRVEVWSDNSLVERIYERDKSREKCPLGPYIDMERDYIRKKQQKAEQRNSRKRGKC